MKSLAKNSIFNAVYQVLNLIFPLISSMYVARVLMPEGVGRVAYAQNIASYFVTAAALGIPTVGLRAIAGARDDQQELDRAFSSLFVLNAISTTVVLMGYIVLVFSYPAFRKDYQLFLATGMMVLFNYINIEWLFKGNEEYVYIVIRSIAVKIISIGALFLFVQSKDDYIAYAVITTLAFCGNYFFNIVNARKYVTFTLRNLDIRRYIKLVILLSGSLFLSAIYSKLDTTMLGVMCGEASVGYYSYAHKVLQIGIGFCTAVTTAFLPRLSYYFDRNKEEFYALVGKGVQIVAFLSIPAAVGLCILAPDAVRILFGYEFLPAAVTLRIFSALIVVFAFGNLLCYQMMLCSGNEKKYVLLLLAAAFLNIMLNSVLIPKWKENGAAIASVCTELFINIVSGIYHHKKLNLRYKRKPIGDAIISASIMGVCILLIRPMLSESILSFICCITTGVLVYFVVNILLKNQFTRDVLIVVKQKVSG